MKKVSDNPRLTSATSRVGATGQLRHYDYLPRSGPSTDSPITNSAGDWEAEKRYTRLFWEVRSTGRLREIWYVTSSWLAEPLWSNPDVLLPVCWEHLGYQIDSKLPQPQAQTSRIGTKGFFQKVRNS